MMENTKKEDIIIELGGEYIKVGLVGDKIPRKSLRSGYLLKYNSQNPQKYQMIIQQLIYNIFFSHINCSCAGKTVIILEKVYTDRRTLQIIAKTLFKKLKIQKIELALSCVTPLYLTGRYSGLVVSAGATSIEIMPIYQGYPLFRHYECLSIGTSILNKFIRNDLAILNKEIPLQNLKLITQDDITDLRNTYGAINVSNQPVSVNLKKMRLKFAPEKIQYNIFFGNQENQEHNIAYSFLKVLNEIPIQCLDAISKNIVLAGGFWRIKGMQKYFKKNVIENLPKFNKLISFKLKEKLGFVSWSFNPSDVAWIGCSIGCSIKSVDHLSLRKAEYLQNGFSEKIMKSYFLSF